MDFNEWILSQIEAEKYWFHRINLDEKTVTPGWSDAKNDKLPYFGIPEDMSGMRVLDIGHAEGFFSFEAERRGATEIIGIDNYPPMNRKFNLCKYAQNSKANSYMMSVYDLDPKKFGTFDMVFFFGVLYHLRNPILALEKIASVCSGTLLLQTATCSNTSSTPMAEFHPFGLTVNTGKESKTDPTCFWFPNTACVDAMLQHTGFIEIEQLSKYTPSVGAVFKAKSPQQSRGKGPDESKAPWS